MLCLRRSSLNPRAMLSVLAQHRRQHPLSRSGTVPRPMVSARPQFSCSENDRLALEAFEKLRNHVTGHVSDDVNIRPNAVGMTTVGQGQGGPLARARDGRRGRAEPASLWDVKTISEISVWAFVRSEPKQGNKNVV
jgi:hypothetical protein